MVYILFFFLGSGFSWTYGGDDFSENAYPPLYLFEGQTQLIEGVIPQKASIEPKNIARIEVKPEGLRLEGLQAGAATLEFEAHNKHLRIPVQVERKLETPENVTSLKIKGLHVQTIQDQCRISGALLTRKEYQRFLFLNTKQWRNCWTQVQVAHGLVESLLEQGKRALSQNYLNDVQIRRIGHAYILIGRVSSSEEVQLAESLIKPILPNIQNQIPTPLKSEPTVLVRVFIVELSRHAHQILGFQWPSSTSQAALISPHEFLFNPQWFTHINHLSNKGLARILSEPLLALKIGAEAELSAGGEIPLKISGRHENKVIWKQYGLKINLKAIALSGKQIHFKVQTESSQLDDSTAIEGVPGIKNNRLSTDVDAYVGRPFLLTGLFQRSQSKDVEKLPLLGDLPLLGELFKSRRFRNHESELLIAFLPSLGFLQPNALPPRTRIQPDFKWRIQD